MVLLNLYRNIKIILKYVVYNYELKSSQSLLLRRHQGTPVTSSSEHIFTVGLKQYN